MEIESPLSQCQRSTRLDGALDQLTLNLMDELVDAARHPNASESTRLKNAWVEAIYERYVAKTNALRKESGKLPLLSFPLQADLVASFVVFCGPLYSPGSITDVIVPSLKRLEKEKRGLPPTAKLDDTVEKSLKEALKEAVKRTTYQAGTTKQPAITADVMRIIGCMPQGYKWRSLEAALFLCALETGARALTMEAVRLQHINKVIWKEEEKKFLVQITYVVTKGNPSWNHRVAIEGSLDDESSAVCHLARHLLSFHRLDLAAFDTWRLSETQLAERLFGLAKDTMRTRFKAAAERAGYPHELFSFHSMRSGFICSALLNGATITEGTDEKAILEATAFIAGWKVGGKAQLGYLKECSTASLVASRVVSASPGSRVDRALIAPEVFHSITLKAPSWSREINYEQGFNSCSRSAFFPVSDEGFAQFREASAVSPDYARKSSRRIR